jgi:type II secretory pathway pseudopilin PulG
VRDDAVTRCTAAGFTLVELAVALFVVTLLLGALLRPLGMQVDQRQVAETQKAIDEIREALLGHSTSNGYLPCPDALSGAGANDGLEDVQADGTCRSTDGNVPWVTLGTSATDVWNNRFRYHVDDSFATRAPAAVFGLATSASVKVCATATCATALTSGSPNGAVAVILSHGKNGRGAMNALTNAVNPAPSSADELENANGNVTLVSRAPSAAGSPAGEFDDVVSWVSKFVLYNRMVNAGRLP